MEGAAQTYYAIAVLKGDGYAGTVKFVQTFGHQVQIQAELTGLKKGLHGFHIHEFGNLTNGCTSAGGHYNPHLVNHGGPASEVRHVGDLGNIEAADDTTPVVYKTTDHLIMIYGDLNNVVGRSVVVHADTDDLGVNDNDGSRTTGNAGARVMCGVIG